jgi:hypothetical protein
MANQSIDVTLEGVHEAIRAKIQEKFLVLRTVECYLDERTELPTPACLIEMTECEPQDDQKLDTGQFAFKTRWDAYFLVSFKTPQAKLTVRKLAVDFAIFAEENRWGLKIAPAKVMWAGDDDFKPELEKFEIWRVEWSQVLYLGETPSFEGAIPTPYLGFSPDIGTGHEDDYIALEDLP